MINVLITGASKGIGRAISLEIARTCSTLVLISRTKELLVQLKTDIYEINPDCDVLVEATDLTNEEGIKICIDSVVKKISQIDVLINCAGKAIPETGFQEISLQLWNEIFATNVTSVFLLVKAVLPLLKKSRSPAIINIASTAGMSSRPGWSAYAASKAALINLSGTLAEELKPYKIPVYCVSPGRTATNLRKILAPDEDSSKIMQPEDVARVINVLLADTNRVLAGTPIVVKGN